MSALPRLSRALVSSPDFGARQDIEVPASSSIGLPEKVVQFGTGAFLRGFIEYFIDDANRAGEFGGSVVAVSSTGSPRDRVLNEQDGLYTLAIRGMEHGAPRERY